jgi:hypothetical protein
MKAFPHIAKVHMMDGNSIIKEEITSGGMDLRDYFAAKAMQAMLSWEDVGDFDVSKEAYMMADAMISERDRK